jgi:hypothetical protein
MPEYSRVGQPGPGQVLEQPASNVVVTFCCAAAMEHHNHIFIEDCGCIREGGWDLCDNPRPIVVRCVIDPLATTVQTDSLKMGSKDTIIAAVAENVDGLKRSP